MGDPLQVGYVKIHSKGLWKKWKTAYIALYQDSSLGISRMEIFKSSADYDANHVRNLFVLKDLVFLREMCSPQMPLMLRLQKKEAQLDLGLDSIEDLKLWKSAISQAAFPGERSPTVASPLSLSKFANEDPYDEPWDSKIIRVEVIPNHYSNALGLFGHYELTTTENCLLLKVQHRMVTTWAYNQLYRIGVGEASMFLETSNNSVFEFVCVKISRLLGQLQELMPMSCDTVDSADELPSQHLSGRVYTSCYSVLPNPPVVLRKLENIPEEPKEFAKVANTAEMRGSVNLSRFSREYNMQMNSPVGRNTSNDSVNNLFRDSSEDVPSHNDTFVTVEDDTDDVFVQNTGVKSKFLSLFGRPKQSRHQMDSASVTSEQSATKIRTDFGSKAEQPKLVRNFFKFKRASRNLEATDNLSLQLDDSSGPKVSLAGGKQRSFDDSDAGFHHTDMSRNSARLSFRNGPPPTSPSWAQPQSKPNGLAFRPAEPPRLYRQNGNSPAEPPRLYRQNANSPETELPPTPIKPISPINRSYPTPFSYTANLGDLVNQKKSLSPASARRANNLPTANIEPNKPPARPPLPEILKKSVRFDPFAAPVVPERSKQPGKSVTFEPIVKPPLRSDSIELIDSASVGHILSGYTVNEDEENLLGAKKKGGKSKKDTVV